MRTTGIMLVTDMYVMLTSVLFIRLQRQPDRWLIIMIALGITITRLMKFFYKNNAISLEI